MYRSGDEVMWFRQVFTTELSRPICQDTDNPDGSTAMDAGKIGILLGICTNQSKRIQTYENFKKLGLSVNETTFLIPLR